MDPDDKITYNLEDDSYTTPRPGIYLFRPYWIHDSPEGVYREGQKCLNEWEISPSDLSYQICLWQHRLFSRGRRCIACTQLDKIPVTTSWEKTRPFLELAANELRNLHKPKYFE